MADSPDAIPVFATTFHTAILAPMPSLEINATQTWLIALDGNVVEIISGFVFVLAKRRRSNRLKQIHGISK